MTIINPASENQNYCINGSSATWFVNGNQLISFNQSDLTNGTKFVKQTINGLPYKIIWDGGGTGKEHIINNPLNYSYSFPTLLNIPYSRLEYRNSSGSLRTRSYPENIRLFPQGRWCYGIPGAERYQVYNMVTGSILGDDCFITNSIRYLDGSLNQIFSIKINDGGVISEYPIINKNSVQTIFNQGGIRYTFTAGSQSLNQQYQTNQNISLKCGIDCPPETCVKCRDGDYVCCYGGDGTVIERIYDPNFEIEAC